jgi:tetratricopeptide (TPR) repeat protein
MALVHEKLFASVSPIWRRTEGILADIHAAGSGAGDVSRGTVGQIELLVKTADQHFTQRRYQAALTAYKDAWARIYRLVNPGFDNSAYARANQFVVLPGGSTLEVKIQLTGTRIVDGIRPPDLTHDTVRLPLGEVEAPPPELRRYLAYGFTEPESLNQVLQDAAVSGVGLLLDGKPASAVDVMRAALTKATRNGAKVDGALVGALQLNLASAVLQLRQAEDAAKLAEQAAGGYRKREDPVGVAQSLHLGGIAARQAGDKESATRLFAEAAETLAKYEEDNQRAPAPPTGLLPVPTKPAPNRALPALDPTTKVDLADSIQVTRDTTPLRPVVGKDASTLTFRIPGRAEGWGVLDLSDPLLNQQRARTWTVGVPTGRTTATFVVGEGKPAVPEQVAERLYRSRVSKDRAIDLSVIFVDAATVSFYLGHLYGYVLPLKIGDCFHELGQYAEAEASYRQAAGYGSLNTTIEASQVWVRLARNVLQHASTLYQAESFPAARAEYEKIITRTHQVPASFRYTTTALDDPANEARTLIGGIDNDPLPEVNPEIAAVVLEALSLLTQLRAGLDYYGLLLSPIHTFELLQQVSRGFAQQAVQAEREFINFKRPTRRGRPAGPAWRPGAVGARGPTPPGRTGRTGRPGDGRRSAGRRPAARRRAAPAWPARRPQRARPSPGSQRRNAGRGGRRARQGRRRRGSGRESAVPRARLLDSAAASFR